METLTIGKSVQYRIEPASQESLPSELISLSVHSHRPPLYNCGLRLRTSSVPPTSTYLICNQDELLTSSHQHLSVITAPLASSSPQHLLSLRYLRYPSSQTILHTLTLTQHSQSSQSHQTIFQIMLSPKRVVWKLHGEVVAICELPNAGAALTGTPWPDSPSMKTSQASASTRQLVVDMVESWLETVPDVPTLDRN